jgi:hypothetical protein
MRKMLLAAALAFAAVPVLMATSAAAADYPPSCGALTLSASSADPGGSVTQTGSGFAPGSSVQVTLGSSSTTTVADGSGTEQSAVTVPASTEPGNHSVSVSGTDASGGTRTLCATLTVNGLTLNVAGASGGGPGGGLAFTGSHSATLAGIGVAAVIGGIFFVALSRRRALHKS